MIYGRQRPSYRGALWAGAALALVCLGGPLGGAWLVRASVLPRLSARLGGPVSVGGVWVRWGQVELRDLEIGGGARPAVRVPRVAARFRMGPLLLGRIEVTDLLLAHPRIEAIRGGPDDNVSQLLDHYRARAATGRPARRRLRIEKVRIVDGALGVADEETGEAVVQGIDAELSPDGPGQARLSGASLKLIAGPRLAASGLTVDFTLRHGRLDGLPLVTIAGGEATPLRGLELTGIHGTIHPDAQDPTQADLAVRGSYGGAHAELWNANGWIKPGAHQGELKLRAARFKLSQLDEVLQNGARVLDARHGEADGRFDLLYRGDQVTFAGAFHLKGLTVAHPKLGPIPVAHVGFDARTRGTLDVPTRHLVLEEATVDFRGVHATLTADVENLGGRPKVAARFQVRPLDCQAALDAIPAELTPRLQGFVLKGTFSTDLHVGVDFAHLDQPIDLGGKVGIEGCKVVEAPPDVDADRLLATFEQTVQVERGKWLTFFVGPENPSFVPYDQISRHVVNSIMTTEDNGFFHHHGFIVPEFRTALQQNLQRGYFRLGASSITMQMVKNVLLSREKTLSRKLQEMFLTWYLEHRLTKERILEIYFNVIEFGPGIYGIGRAARHYFGKAAKDLAPQEAAFFSSILPNPKRRYIQYCHANGLLDKKWQAYVDRIMKRSHERGRLTDEEYQQALATPVQFDRTEAMPERDCVAMVKRLTAKPPPPPPPK